MQTQEHMLHKADDVFRELGATHYRDSHHPTWNALGSILGGELFSRHYFNLAEMEIGICMIDLMPEEGLYVFDSPRTWRGDPHELHQL